MLIYNNLFFLIERGSNISGYFVFNCFAFFFSVKFLSSVVLLYIFLRVYALQVWVKGLQIFEVQSINLLTVFFEMYWKPTIFIHFAIDLLGFDIFYICARNFFFLKSMSCVVNCILIIRFAVMRLMIDNVVKMFRIIN